MSFKKSKLDLLIRVRYQNPLPAPPCPPKLLNIPTDPSRYAKPEFTDAIANETPLPMVVDAEMGMPLDLGQWECLWQENGDDSELNPDPNDLPKLDPKDEFLLGDPASGAPYTNGHASGPATPTPITPANVTWLRRTEYISREQRPAHAHELKMVVEPQIDVSRAAQIRQIEASFAAASEADEDLSRLRHPNKPNVTAVDSYDVLPDAEIWANTYDLFRFSERPGDRPPDVEDPRLDCAILRPMESDGEHFLAYYLTKDDESALEFKRRRLDPPSEPHDPVHFQFERDYELRKIEREVPNEFLLVLDEGTGEENLYGDVSETPTRPKGAYYKNIERKMMLKRKRQNIHEAYADKWDVVRVTHQPMPPDDEAEWKEAAAEVNNPQFLNQLMDRDAEGEVDESHATNGDGGLDVVGGA
ncbi:hypothetical protein PUNSTDRAFT_51813 [Punctularia strigosozonata HHB-11173 SS5]|uniref:uncharacterized protein n=1 Tax=Punctularia strigosozonata (strain HHB-11173) TaxID=741275 RepID=UPI0004416A05|nr:uncharacterized protein PUNSTDRAFT_51813 [Punctularia strigosozonata HHB-11173 SS5]EIN09583.1 hypothetical protein PUNSTDRAFT_51813 [Punctularia strigosozonata HHB-11173 SS5]